ncbi:Regulator of polyketide synthase expression [Pseudonocardia sp. Ae168_Ps1]|uniref:GAF domain-containing protein n=1 Tax=Pseudonocardia sp. Ae168_Ps1 TaxID=1885029 RepID=UPI0009658843|nr:GAF domain-containing protein [Pseudonocardia sp. Ae168_Ps1]OLL71497.1 Regulator of polyketide synthase expression [Pseudonocardia sp. Ae168_Ps1]
MRTVLDLLRLLAERADGDASADELERAAAELASEPEAGALALRVLAAMDAGRRRESELAALVGIARDLASESDTGSVLDTIVRRARALLGTDVAYLTLYDAEHGDTYMRVTSGSVSRRFQTLRLPLGAGLGGLVAASRTPHWTGRYAGDDRYRHTEAIDTAVGEEGIVAICGTPLLVDDEFVGVLFAANRSARPFTPDDVALLGSLAALAAVSLVQTRRLADTAATLEALRGGRTRRSRRPPTRTTGSPASCWRAVTSGTSPRRWAGCSVAGSPSWTSTGRPPPGTGRSRRTSTSPPPCAAPTTNVAVTVRAGPSPCRARAGPGWSRSSRVASGWAPCCWAASVTGAGPDRRSCRRRRSAPWSGRRW